MAGVFGGVLRKEEGRGRIPSGMLQQEGGRMVLAAPTGLWVIPTQTEGG